jgi:hypothetical protein
MTLLAISIFRDRPGRAPRLRVRHPAAGAPSKVRVRRFRQEATGFPIKSAKDVQAVPTPSRPASRGTPRLPPEFSALAGRPHEGRVAELDLSDRDALAEVDGVLGHGSVRPLRSEGLSLRGNADLVALPVNAEDAAVPSGPSGGLLRHRLSGDPHTAVHHPDVRPRTIHPDRQGSQAELGHSLPRGQGRP